MCMLLWDCWVTFLLLSRIGYGHSSTVPSCYCPELWKREEMEPTNDKDMNTFLHSVCVLWVCSYRLWNLIPVVGQFDCLRKCLCHRLSKLLRLVEHWIIDLATRYLSVIFGGFRSNAWDIHVLVHTKKPKYVIGMEGLQHFYMNIFFIWHMR